MKNLANLLILSVLTLSLCFIISCPGIDGLDGKDGTDGKDGEIIPGLNTSGSVATWDYLLLEHNLGRDDLTFTGQFVKDGFIYDYSDYREIFSSGVTNEKISATVFEGASTYTYSKSTPSLNNGDFVIVYRDEDNSGYGTFVIYNQNGTLETGHVVFKDAITYYISAVTLNIGDFVLAYRDETNSGYGTFEIYGEYKLSLEKVNNNEVLLWNYTNETLYLMLSVNQ